MTLAKHKMPKRTKIFFSIILFFGSLLLFAACDSSAPDYVRFESIVWDNPAHYRQTEYGYDEDGDFHFTLERSNNDCLNVLYVGQIESLKDIQTESLLDDMQKVLQASLAVSFHPSKHYSNNGAIHVRREFFQDAVISAHLAGFIELVLIDSHLFSICAIGDKKSVNTLSQMSNSVHSPIDPNGGRNSEYIGISDPSDKHVLQLCQYIPDHELRPEAQSYMTSDFYTVLFQSFEVAADDPMGAGEFLFYFVTGNGGSKPYYEVLSVSRTDEHKAIAVIRVRDLWEEEIVPSKNAEQHIYTMSLVNEDGKWLIDDFDNKKEECRTFIKYNKPY